MTDPLTASIAATLRAARTERGVSVSALADRSGVSRAMITKVERGTAQPTAALLGRLVAALGMTLSQLVARAEEPGGRLARAAEQPTWTDPRTGYVRRAVSPDPGGPVELVEIELPPDARIDFPAASYAHVHHRIWVLDGRLRFTEGDAVHDLDTGDCLAVGPPVPCGYHNPGDRPCRYLVVLARKAP